MRERAFGVWRIDWFRGFSEYVYVWVRACVREMNDDDALT